MDFINLETKYSSLVELIHSRAKYRPKQSCFTYLEDGEVEALHLDYAEIDRRARSVAVDLLKSANEGDFALLVFSPGLEFVIAFIGCLYANIIAIPAPPPKPKQKAERIAAIINDAHVRIIITTNHLLAGLEGKLTQFPQLQSLHCMTFDDSNYDSADLWQLPKIDRDTLAFLQYTSGSTDKPKGVMVSHGNLLSNSHYIQTAFDLSPTSVAVTWLPSFHDMGLIDGIIQPLYTGYHTYVMAPTSFLMHPIRWLRAISKYRATHCGGPNFAYETCVKRTKPEQREDLDLSCWLSAYNGAEPIHADTVKRFTETFEPYGFKAEYMYPCYGLAEATLMVSGGPVHQTPVTHLIDASAIEKNLLIDATDDTENVKSIMGSGQIWLDTKVVIVNAKTRIKCSADEIGEIWVSGSGIAQGYWNRPEATEQVFNAFLADTGEGPFLRTGDLGFMDKSELFVVGRLKDMIIIRGRNYYPQDIERTAGSSHEALRSECCAAFKVDVGSEERLFIVHEVERCHLRTIEASKVISSLRKSIAELHGLQVHGVALLKTGSIPKTSSGKIQRALCREHLLRGKLNSIEGSTGNFPMTTTST